MTLITAAFLAGCTPDPTDTEDTTSPWPAIERAEQRTGDPDAGWQALRYGDFVGAGVPADTWFDLIGTDTRNLLQREGDSAGLSQSYNLFDAPNGVEVVGGIACFGCHSSTLDGEFIVGLGSAFSDYSQNDASTYNLAGGYINATYGADSPEAEAYWPLWRAVDVLEGQITTPFAGVNPAFAIERGIAAHRDPQTLDWVEEPLFAIDDFVLASDVPAWWHVQKKGGLYYTGQGQGDFVPLLTQTSIVGIEDADHAADIAEAFSDVLAWMMTLEPPVWPGEIDATRAEEGAEVFAESCSRCHGTYGEEETYTTWLIPLEEVGTDPAYAQGLTEGDFADWLAESWYGSGDAIIDPVPGYVAPPLDGIWATAPYLHNGAVPDLVSLLDPDQRPTVWQRSFSSSTYDYDRVGWPWSDSTAGEPGAYDTTQYSYSNQGHEYGAALTLGEREAVLEYLKTL
ncbi:MAG: mono/diheme cytochrome c family protein [Myxococcota bacterium]|jgi:mono/diheme cytochrome c family protein